MRVTLLTYLLKSKCPYGQPVTVTIASQNELKESPPDRSRTQSLQCSYKNSSEAAGRLGIFLGPPYLQTVMRKGVSDGDDPTFVEYLSFTLYISTCYEILGKNGIMQPYTEEADPWNSTELGLGWSIPLLLLPLLLNRCSKIVRRQLGFLG